MSEGTYVCVFFVFDVLDTSWCLVVRKCLCSVLQCIVLLVGWLVGWLISWSEVLLVRMCLCLVGTTHESMFMFGCYVDESMCSWMNVCVLCFLSVCDYSDNTKFTILNYMLTTEPPTRLWWRLPPFNREILYHTAFCWYKLTMKQQGTQVGQCSGRDRTWDEEVVEMLQNC